MRIRATSLVQCRTAIQADTRVECGGLQYTFVRGANGFITEISIECEVDNPEAFYSKITADPRPGIAADFQVHRDDALLDRLEREFQELESHLAFSFSLSRIRWDELEYRLITDSPEQLALVGVSSMRRWRDTPPGLLIKDDSLARLIASKERYQSLVIPLSFFREGQNDLETGRFINAFFNFYFVLEGWFADGNTKNYLVEKAFRDDPGFVSAVTDCLEATRSARNEYAIVLKECGDPPSVERVARWLVSTRGRLHHFTNPLRPDGTPLRQNDYEHIASFTRGIVIFAAMTRILAINTGKA